MTFFKRLAKGKITIPYFPIGGLLLLFLLLTFISLINSLMFERVAFNWAMNDFRIMLYYTLFFSTAWGIKDRRQLKTLLAGVFILANLVVGLMIVQQFLGIDNLLTSGMSRWQITEEVDGSLRILPPLIFMIAVLASISSAFAFFAEEPRVKFLSAFQALFLVVGLLLTFTRSAWLTIIMAVLIVIAFAANEKREKVVGSMIFVTPALLIVLSLSLVQSSQRADIPYVGSIFNRVTSIFQTDETVQSDSLQWRVFENSEAMKSIQNRPIFGVGLGNQYREITIAHGEAAGSRTGNDITRLTRYVHNSILSMAVKMGLPTLILFLSTYLLFIYKSWKLYPKTDSSIKKSVVIGVIAIFIPSIFWAQFFTLFTESNHIMSVALFMGVISVISDLTESRSQTNSAVGELN
ncbi:MAG: O-antigen ligase family protein [Chloroflexota bacterium]